MKIAYNGCFGGFGLSNEAFELLLTRKGIPFEKVPGRFGDEYRRTDVRHDPENTDDKDYLWDGMFTKDRLDPDLIAVIEELGAAANGMCASLCITDAPAGSRYRIDEYDGNESVMTPDDYDWSTAT